MLSQAMAASPNELVLHLGQIPDFTIGKIPPPHHNSLLHALRLVWYRGLQLFHLLFTSPRLSYLTERFRTLIRQSKGLYSNALLPSLCASWPIGTFWYCFASSTAVSWQQFYPIGQLYRVFSSQWMLTHFFTTFIQLCSNVWCRQPSVMQAGDSDEIFHCTCCFLSTCPTFVFVLPCFLMTPNSMIMLSSKEKKITPSNEFFKRDLVIQRSILMRKTFT